MAIPIKNPSALLAIFDAVIDGIDPQSDAPITPTTLHTLTSLLPSNLILSALDIIDRGDLVKHRAPRNGGWEMYEVLGSTGVWSVYPNLYGAKRDDRLPFYCSCPAFTFAVLKSKTHIMCKHVLATLLAARLNKFVDHPIASEEEMANIILRAHS